MANLEALYKKLIEKHEEYIELVDTDEEFTAEEAWIDDCQQRFMQLRIKTKDYLMVKSQCGQSVENVIENEVTPEITLEHSEIVVTVNDGGEQGDEANPGSGQDPSQQGQGQVQETVSLNENHDSDATKRDAMTYLRACLQGKPLELIKGIGNDYDGAWKYLESIYGDPRYVSDQVTQDLSKFRPLKEGEDSRFCDLVHLVKRSFNTRKGVWRPHDMDNNHILSLIEQKMCVEDRKIWAREVEREKSLASLQGLMSWMETEMKSRMRASHCSSKKC